MSFTDNRVAASADHPAEDTEAAAMRSVLIVEDNADGRESLQFFFELQDSRSPLLDFQTRGRDKWQLVHAWLIGERRVPD